MIKEHFFQDRSRLFEHLADFATKQLADALANSSRATLLVSGGSTPVPLYELLAKQSIAWKNVDVALVDERWVDDSDNGSNARLIKSTLLQNQARVAHFVGMKNDSASAALGQTECEAAYQQLKRPFDLSVVGMGPDGHTASLFPNAKGLDAALDIDNDDLCTDIIANKTETTGELVERMSLTLRGLLATKQIVLPIIGDEKLAIYHRAKQADQFNLSPISALLQQSRVPISVYWSP